MLCWFQGCNNDSGGGIFVKCTYLIANQITFSADSGCLFAVVMHRVCVCLCVHSHVCYCGGACTRSWCGRVSLCVSLCVAGVCQCVWVLACLVAVLFVCLLPRLFARFLDVMFFMTFGRHGKKNCFRKSRIVVYLKSTFTETL